MQYAQDRLIRKCWCAYSAIGVASEHSLAFNLDDKDDMRLVEAGIDALNNSVPMYMVRPMPLDRAS